MRAVLLGVAAAIAGIAVVIIARANQTETVYSTVAVQAARARHPQAWAGRRVLVQGRITIAYALQPHRGVVWWLPVDCTALTPCLSDHQIQSLTPRGAVLHLLLRSPGARVPGPQALLVLRPPAVASAFGALSHLPVIARLLPAPAAVRWGAGHIYRIQVFQTHLPSCRPLECDDGQLLDMVR